MKEKTEIKKEIATEKLEATSYKNEKEFKKATQGKKMYTKVIKILV